VSPTREQEREDNLDPIHYDEAIAFVDAEIGRMVRAIDALGVGGRTVVLLVADHGEALGVEDDGSRLHGHSLYEELAHVPLVALVPWLPTGRRVPEVVSLVDVAPTLLDLAGVPIPASFRGTSLFAERHAPEPRAALLERLNAPWLTTTFIGPGSVVEWGLREGPWKLLLEEPRARLFDLEADPKETTDVSAAHPDVAGYLAGRIARASPALGGGGAAVATVPAGELERPLGEALKQLGYLQ
jgi:arylsulfatase A-like enzyme